MPLLLLSHSQDGEIDLKLLTKVLAPEHEVREVRGCGNTCPSAAQGGRLAVTEGMHPPWSPAMPLSAGRCQLGPGPSVLRGVLRAPQ